jgi:acyl-CoA synthetase (AMP-forming)/AMP-acid ligase II
MSLQPLVAGSTAQEAWRPQTLSQLLERTVASHPQREALVAIDASGHRTRVRYAELLSRVRLMSGALVGLGVSPGDRVATWLTNSLEFIETYLGAVRLGASVVPLNTFLRRGELTETLRAARAQHLVLFDAIGHTSVVDELAREDTSGHELPELRSVVVARRTRSHGRLPSKCLDLEAVLAEADQFAAAADELAGLVRPDDLALIKFTSGSTGKAKGVELEHWGLVTNALLHTRRIGLNPEDRWMSSMPMFHLGGSGWGLASCLATGATLVFSETFDAGRSLELIEDERCTAHWGVNTMLRREMDLPDFAERDLRSLRMVGGATELATEVAERFGVDYVVRAYGATECYGPIAVSAPDDPLVHDGVTPIGRPLDGVECRVRDPGAARDLRTGGIGQVQVRRMVMRGYFEQLEETARVVDPDGWFLSSDFGLLDDHERLVFTGRAEGRIKVGGENVTAEEVEACLRLMPEIDEVVVVAVPDPMRTEVPCACIVARSEVTLDRVIEWCAERLAPFKVPRRVIRFPELPLTGPGKFDRATIRARAGLLAGHGDTEAQP